MNEKVVGFLSSLGFHALMILVMFLLVYTTEPNFLKIEIIEFGYRTSANNENFISPEASSPASSGIPDRGSDSNLIPDKVNLPKAVSDSNDPLYFPNKIETAYNNMSLDNNVGNRNLKEQLDDEIIAGENIEITENPVLGASDNYLNSLTNRISTGDSGESPYILEGEITTRSIIKKIIPEYPDDFQQNSRVKVKFEVLANGSVNNMIIVQKSEPILEEISLGALEQWKFNTLTSDITQIGYITFIFQLK